ncbi:DUF2398 family protein, partial [Kitasatospora sp. LaBMicrA B282]|uniref:DUF2398 family protein n=1 Tax=Kitasatospora sp. LaBMicrA B282 TaxID=3420949 RepID=UPI003D11C64A
LAGPGTAGDPGALAELAAERRAAARLLLAHPLVTASGPQAQAFPLVRRHADWLTGRFAELLGYPLTVTDRFARLTKAALGRGALRRLSVAGVPCTPAQYAALVLALAALLAGPDRHPAAALGAELAAHPLLSGSEAADDAGEAAGAGEAVEAGDAPAAGAAVAAALAVLTEWQVLTAAPADDDQDQLLVDHELLAALVAGYCPVDPEGPPAPRTTIPVAVRRRLVETPAVLFEELSGLEREWLRESRAREVALFADFLGLTAEARREGIALLDPAGELTDLRLPGPGALAHAALLLAERLVDQLRPLPGDEAEEGLDGVGAVPIAEALIDGILGDLADEYDTDDRVREQHAAHWRQAHRADRSAFRREVLALLHAMRLIAPAGSGDGPVRCGWTLLAPAARYAAPLELRAEPGTGRHSRR